MAVDSCLKCGKGVAQHSGLCANCMLDTNITDKLDDFNKMPKIDIPQAIFFGPDLTDYVMSLTKKDSKPSGRYNMGRYNMDTKKYDVTTTRNGVNFKGADTKKLSINSIVYDITLTRNGVTPKKDSSNKYTFMTYKIPAVGYLLDKKSSYGIIPNNKYSIRSYTPKGGEYKGSKAAYSGAGSKSSYSGMSSSK